MSYTFDIFTDSACDSAIPDDVGMININVNFGMATFPATSPLDDFYDLLERNNPQTAASNSHEICQALRPSLITGRDVLYITMASSLSIGTKNNAQQAIEKLRHEFPKRTIEYVDSHCVSGGQAILVNTIANLQRDGVSLKHAMHFVDCCWPRIIHLFTTDRAGVNLMYRGGRITKAQAIIAGVLDIMPVILFDEHDKAKSIQKARGTERTYDYMVRVVQKNIAAYTDTIWVYHGACPDQATKITDLLREALPSINIQLGRIGPVVGAHVGAGTVALFFVANYRREDFKVRV